MPKLAGAVDNELLICAERAEAPIGPMPETIYGQSPQTEVPTLDELLAEEP